MLFACGFNIGGYVLYVEDGALRFHYNFVDTWYMNAESSIALPEGSHVFGLNFDFLSPGRGIATVSIDGKPAGESVEFTDTGFMVKSCIGVGRYSASAVKRSHRFREKHFAYTGSYSKVELSIGSPEDFRDSLDALLLHKETE